MATLTVIMAVYIKDNPDYFAKALRSIWDDQILKPSEIILIHDGPLTEAHYQIIDTFRKHVGTSLKEIVNTTNIGLTKSLNKGIEMATGDYIARMDSDDIALPDRFILQVEYMACHPEVMVLGGGMLEIDENEIIGSRRLYPCSMDRIKHYIPKANPIPHPTVLFNAELFKKGFRYDEKFRKNQDLKLWFDLIKEGVIMENLPDIILKFRRTEDTYTKRASKISRKSEYEIYDSGIRDMYGRWSVKRVYPLVRYAVKSMPPWAAKTAYKYLFRKSGK